MPLIDQLKHSTFKLLIWKIDEPMDYFIEALELDAFIVDSLNERFKNKKSLHEWLASRYSVCHLCKINISELSKDNKGKLHQIHGDPISLSHCMPFCAVINSAQAVGIDIQTPSSKLMRIAQKFIPTEQLKKIKCSDQEKDLIHFHWGIKEAIFKAYGKGKLSYKEHILVGDIQILDNQMTELNALLKKNNEEIAYRVFLKKTNDFYLSYCIQQE